MEGGERLSQSHFGEYYWLGPDPTQNTGGKYIPIFLVAVIILTHTGNNHYIIIYYCLTSAQRLL